MIVRLLEDGPAPGAWNMAFDEQLLRSARNGQLTLRFYLWDPPCLSFGRNQPARGLYDVTRARDRGIEIVRRPTGGRAVYHDRELTYAVAAPAGSWGGLRESHRRINHALRRGLRALGAPVALAPADLARAASAPGALAPAPPVAPPPSVPRPSTRACFRDPLPGEVSAEGRKLVGSAQWRENGGLLQHGSILLHDDQRMADELRSGARVSSWANGVAAPGRGAPANGTPAPGRGAASLSEFLDPLPTRALLIGALAGGFEEEFGLRVRPGKACVAEMQAAEMGAARYRHPEWTWRR